MPDDRYEIIVVDDASTDDSWERIREFGTMVKRIGLEQNVGVAAASNAGIELAQGEYIVRVDGDDFINRNFLHAMSEILHWNEDIGFVYCDHIIVTPDGERRQSLNTLEKLLDHGAGVMFRYRYLEAIGLYDEKLRNCEDYDLIRRYIRNFDGYNLKVPYYRYFQREGSLSKAKETRAELKKAIDEQNRQGTLGKTE